MAKDESQLLVSSDSPCFLTFLEQKF